MADPTWSVEGEAAKLCGCARCRGGEVAIGCRQLLLTSAVRAGLARAQIICEARAVDLRKRDFPFDADTAERCARAISNEANLGPRG